MMTAQANDPRWLMAKLEALKVELVDAYEMHLYWQTVTPGDGPPMTFILDSGDEAVLRAAKLDLRSLPPEMIKSIVDTQLYNSVRRYGEMWDEIGKLSAIALQALTTPEPARGPTTP